MSGADCLAWPAASAKATRKRSSRRVRFLLRRFFLLAPHALLLTALVAACSRDPVVEHESFVFGTRVQIAVFGESRDQADDAAAAVLAEFDRLHRAYHTWQPSELTRLNGAFAQGTATPISPELAGLLVDAAAWERRSEGLFNPAIGGLVALWGFHADTFAARVPPEVQRLQWVRAKPSLADIRIAAGSARSANKAVRVDLGGYAKGYALDRAVRILKSLGVRNALVNIGGNVMALGTRGDRPWRIGIQHPRKPGVIATLDLRDGEAVGSSGDYQRYFETGGRRYCHLIDPRDGEPVQGVQSVTVLVLPGPRAGTFSDVASKPLFVAGPDHWRAMAGKIGVTHALFVDGQGRVEMTEAMKARIGVAGDDR